MKRLIPRDPGALRADGTVVATAVLNMNSHKITNLTDGSSAQDAAAFNQAGGGGGGGGGGGSSDFKSGYTTIAADNTPQTFFTVDLPVSNTIHSCKIFWSVKATGVSGKPIATMGEHTIIMYNDGGSVDAYIPAIDNTTAVNAGNLNGTGTGTDSMAVTFSKSVSGTTVSVKCNVHYTSGTFSATTIYFKVIPWETTPVTVVGTDTSSAGGGVPNSINGTKTISANNTATAFATLAMPTSDTMAGATVFFFVKTYAVGGDQSSYVWQDAIVANNRSGSVTAVVAGLDKTYGDKAGTYNEAGTGTISVTNTITVSVSGTTVSIKVTVNVTSGTFASAEIGYYILPWGTCTLAAA